MASLTDAGPASPAASAAPIHPLALRWPCRACGAHALRVSRPATKLQRLVRAATPLVLCRCHECMRRSWQLPEVFAGAAARLAAVKAPANGPGAASPGAHRRSGAGALAAARLAVNDRVAAWSYRLERHRRRIALVLLLAAVLVALAIGLALAVRHLRRPLERTAAAAATGGRAWISAVEERLLPQPEAQAPAPPAPTAVPARPSRPARRVARAERAPTEQAVAAAGEGAWGAARWGMSLPQVRRAIPEAKVATRRAARATASARAEIAGRPYAVDLRFDAAGRLAAVEVAPAGDADPSQGYEEVVAWLTAKHGPPASLGEDVKPSGSWARLATWTTGESEIELRAWNTLLDDARVLRLDLDRGNIRPAPYGLRVTYAPAGGEPAPDAAARR